jgi:predicted RNA polymerase sigma factor
MADGPDEGLAVVDTIDGLDGYHLFHATRAELLDRGGRPTEAAHAFRRAEVLATHPSETRHLTRRALECERATEAASGSDEKRAC